MNNKKNIFKKLGIILFIFLLIVIYLLKIQTPLYDGKLTLDFSNNTFKSIENLKISFEDSKYQIVIPKLKPLERIIVVPAADVYTIPRKAMVYISYNDINNISIGEFYAIKGDEYNSDVKQFKKIKLYNDNIKSKSNGILGYLMNERPFSKKIIE